MTKKQQILKWLQKKYEYHENEREWHDAQAFKWEEIYHEYSDTGKLGNEIRDYLAEAGRRKS